MATITTDKHALNAVNMNVDALLVTGKNYYNHN